MSTLTDYVSPEESVLVRWEGSLRDHGGSEEVVVGTTDRCVVFCSETGRFGVLPREHVSAVESSVLTRVQYDLEDYRLVMGGGAGLAVTSFLGGVLAPSAILALVLLLFTGGGLWLVEYGWRNREDYDGVDRVESEVEELVVHTDAGTSQTFVFPADDRAGAELSRFVRTNGAASSG